MPTRKQKRRRAKTFRHDYEYAWVKYDEEGNEIEVEPDELPQKPEKPKAAVKAKSSSSARGTRPVREIHPPSWRRSIRRGGLWGGVMVVVVVLLFQDMSLGGRIVLGLLYASAFIPLTYWIDRIAYRSYVKRSGKT
jgi:hypothetical protein